MADLITKMCFLLWIKACAMTIKIEFSEKGVLRRSVLEELFCFPGDVVPNPYFSSIVQRMCEQIWKCYLKSELCRFLYVWIFSGSQCWRRLLLQYLLQVGNHQAPFDKLALLPPQVPGIIAWSGAPVESWGACHWMSGSLLLKPPSTHAHGHLPTVPLPIHRPLRSPEENPETPKTQPTQDKGHPLLGPERTPPNPTNPPPPTPPKKFYCHPASHENKGRQNVKSKNDGRPATHWNKACEMTMKFLEPSPPPEDPPPTPQAPQGLGNSLGVCAGWGEKGGWRVQGGLGNPTHNMSIHLWYSTLVMLIWGHVHLHGRRSKRLGSMTKVEMFSSERLDHPQKWHHTEPQVCRA